MAVESTGPVTSPQRKSPRRLLRVSALLAVGLLCGACQEEPDSDWKLVEAYVTLDTAWHAKDIEINRSQASAEAKDARREVEVGPHPDITLAVAAARAIVSMEGHPRVLDAAEFLVDHTPRLSKTEHEDIELGIDTLARGLGPDWAVVEAYRDDLGAWQEAQNEIAASDDSAEEKRRRWDELGNAPIVARALGAATAILRADGNERLTDAAAFLLGGEVAFRPGTAPRLVEAAERLLDADPDYGEWPERLYYLDAVRRRDQGHNDAIDAVLADVMERAEPVAHATARYYAATGLMRDGNAWDLPDEQRRALRERALELAAGLSDDVADEEFVEPFGVDEEGKPRKGTLAEAEEHLLYRIKFTTVGATAPDVIGTRLDGTEEALSAHAGKVVLVDFWATWCGPCITVLPKLRDLYRSLPDDQFTLLAVSVDEELDAVTDLMKDEPMPWANWHVGDKSEIARRWHVRAFPTYILLDRDGTILARSTGWSDELATLVRTATNADRTISADVPSHSQAESSSGTLGT